MELFVLIFIPMVGVAVVLLLVWGAVKGPHGQKLANSLDRKIVEVKPLGAGSADFKSFGGAILGSLIAGPIGAVIGGTQGGSGRPRQRFAVRYSDGSIKIREFRVNSREYKELMKHVRWDDMK